MFSVENALKHQKECINSILEVMGLSENEVTTVEYQYSYVS